MEKSKLQATLKTLLISYILTGILLVVLAFALYKFRLKEGQIRIGVNAVYIITCLIGGLIMGKASDSGVFLGTDPGTRLFPGASGGLLFAEQRAERNDEPDSYNHGYLCRQRHHRRDDQLILRLRRVA